MFSIIHTLIHPLRRPMATQIRYEMDSATLQMQNDDFAVNQRASRRIHFSHVVPFPTSSLFVYIIQCNIAFLCSRSLLIDVVKLLKY
jgi:hypothetical protein